MKQKLKKNWPWLAILLVVGLLCATYVLGQFRPGNSSAPGLSSSLSATEQVTAARYFLQPLVWVGTASPSEKESQLLLEALQQWKASTNRLARTQLDEFLETLTNSPWAPSLHINLGYYCREHGQTTKALDHWLAAWERTKDFSDGNGKDIGDFALAHLTRLLMVFGRTEDLAAIYEAYGNRVLDRGPLSQMWVRTYEKHLRMLKYPEDSYKCGIYALDKVAQAMGLNYRRGELMKAPSKPAGFTMQELQALSDRFGLGLIAVRRQETNGPIPVPSVVHWQQEHFAAIMEQLGERYRIADPSGLGVLWLTADEIKTEATGYFMVPEGQLSAGFTQISPQESALVVGRWTSCPPNDTEDPPCEDECCNSGSGSGSGGCLGCQVGTTGGMPHWRVSEPFLNVWLQDEPLRYKPAKGPEVVVKIRSKMREEANRWLRSGISKTGKSWICDWVTWGTVDNYQGHFVHVSVEFHGGFWASYSFPIYTTNWSSPLYENSSRMEVLTNGTNAAGFILHFPDGNRFKYAQPIFTNEWVDDYFKFQLSEQIDPQGNKLTFSYDTNNFLSSITDADGNVTTLYYENLSYPDCITRVSSPDGRETRFSYDSDALLTNIVDAAGISSSFIYGNYGWVSSLTTPYGKTFFTNGLGSWDNYIDRWSIITQPDGGQHAYILSAGGSSPGMPDGFEESQLPLNTPLATNGYPYGSLEVTNRSKHNTYYWGPRQFAGLSTTNLPDFAWTEFKRARIRHWIGTAVDSYNNHVDTINHEQDPSPDGTTEGQITWYDYVGKYYTIPEWRGTEHLPTVTARVLPDGSTWYVWNQRNPLGHPTNVINTYTLPNGSVGLRTNIYVYDSNGIDLLEHIGPDGITQESYTYNAYHQPLSKTDALGEVTSYTYNANQQLTSARTPAGLTTTNIYFSGGDSAGFLEKTIDLEINRTNSYTYHSSGNVQTHTDERGMTVTHTWDGLNRLTSTVYPDSTYTSNRYETAVWPMNVFATKDRLGYWTYFGYDSVGRRTAVTNALNNYALYSYCSCGTLDSIQDALNNYTYHYYDYQGNRTLTVFPDNYAVTNTYNLLGQTITVSDSSGSSMNRWYNNQGLLVTVSNNVGLLVSHRYDIDDRPINSVDANGVSVDMTYDDLGRLRTRAYPDSGVEGFLYSSRGLIAYTNQLNKATWYAYDEATRKAFETNANNEVIRFTNNAAGDLLSLTDGKNQTTKWKYDLYGRVTNKIDQAGTVTLKYAYDANDRLTNRWGTAQNTTTTYKYDAVGNLTNVIYKGGVFGSTTTAPEVKMQYDALNRCTNRVDGIGTTKYTYDAAGQVLSEDGPFSSDTMTNTFANRLRTRLDLQQATGVWTNAFGYDSTRRLTNVISSAGAFGYTFRSPGSQLLTAISLPNGSNITNAYDSVVRLTATHLRTSSGVLTNKHEYVYNVGNQRTNQTFTDSSTHGYIYDSIGQLKKADSSVNAEDKSYVYDAAWNLNYRTNNGSTDTFSVDSKNQLTAVSIFTDTYDSSGNLTLHDYASGNNSHIFTYNGENRLTRVDYYFATSLYRTVTLDYDGTGKLRVRKVYDGGGSLLEERRYIYDGWRVIQERDGSNVPTVGYTRGNDLSGSLEGAGGIGGLLCRSHGYSSGNLTNHNVYHCDGNGNITFMLNTNQTKVAEYRYDAFGNLLSSSGSLADANKYRFSSKEWVVIDETYAWSIPGLYYYGYRFYAPTLQRWLNRDPIDEMGLETSRLLRSVPLSIGSKEEVNLYVYVNNGPLVKVDPFGLSICGAFSPGDSEYYMEEGKCYNAQCRINACDNVVKCMSDAAKSGGIKGGICAVVCLVGLVGGPAGYYACLGACLGTDAIATLIDIGSCWRAYSHEKAACSVPCDYCGK